MDSSGKGWNDRGSWGGWSALVARWWQRGRWLMAAAIAAVLTVTVARAQQVPEDIPIQVLQRGEAIALNGEKLPLSWREWQDCCGTHFGIGDTALLQRLGIELANTDDPLQQPLFWFPTERKQPEVANAMLVDARRYVAIEQLVERVGGRLQVSAGVLEVNFTPPRIADIRVADGATARSRGKQIIVELENPTFWTLKQGRDTATVALQAVASSALAARFPVATENEEMEDFNPPLLGVAIAPARTELQIALPEHAGVHLTTLANPPRLAIDVSPEYLPAREIRWMPQIWWRQQYVTLGASRFPVTWLEVDQFAPGIAPRPFWGDERQMTGIFPLQSMAQRLQVAAAINAGFFNRNTKLPLGAVRRDGRWHSGPILNRGAIAWNDAGKVEMGRLRYVETLTDGRGRRWPLPFLNSGYVQAGIGRYTPEWGATYTPLTDNETIALVQGDRVVRQVAGGPAGQSAIPIPPDGYLLAARGDRSDLVAVLGKGAAVRLDAVSYPPEFAAFPQIVGAGPLLVQDSRVVLDAGVEQFSSAFQQQRAPRSAIGTREGGTLIVATVGDRVGGRGPTLTETAQVMQLLGAVDALNLDGGSSASLYLGGQLINRPPATAARVHNGIGLFLE
ncbi:putative periplasmic protein (DUF2233) [Rubidibacter lacunae KORDI 51-2]|uniref:Putative periplasmic protein (DUF2233) n=1 Tax=Rubidibacter lacunae KORDI 51-2 TaxID=582515 RepID=U5DF20_9CHRO|nr:putative periplasmic protein (DUF2233) [Rubidibacter lacunae KORDI 51-2]